MAWGIIPNTKWIHVWRIIHHTWEEWGVGRRERKGRRGRSLRENGQSEKREIEAREKEGENQKMRDKTPLIQCQITSQWVYRTLELRGVHIQYSFAWYTCTDQPGRLSCLNICGRNLLPSTVFSVWKVSSPISREFSNFLYWCSTFRT